MHRSGTSALTRVLNLVGCDLPRTLVAPKQDNIAGFWESQAVVELNQAILTSAGSAWNDWRPFDTDWYTSPVAGPFRERARGSASTGVRRQPVVHPEGPADLPPAAVLDRGRPHVRRTGGGGDAHPQPARRRLVHGDPGRPEPVRRVSGLAAARPRRGGGLARGAPRVRALRTVAVRRARVRGPTRAASSTWRGRSGRVPRRRCAIDEFLGPDLAHHRSDDARLLANPRISPVDPDPASRSSTAGRGARCATVTRRPSTRSARPSTQRRRRSASPWRPRRSRSAPWRSSSTPCGRTWPRATGASRASRTGSTRRGARRRSATSGS